MTKAYAYANVGVEIQAFDSTGVMTSNTAVKLLDKVTDLEFYVNNNETHKVTGKIIRMDILANTARNAVPKTCYHNTGAIIDSIPSQNKTPVKTIFAPVAEDFYIETIVVAEEADDKTKLWYIQNKSIVSVGSVETVVHTVGTGGDFTSLSDAIATAKAGDTLVLSEDFAEDVTLTDGVDLTIDANGAKLGAIKFAASGTTGSKLTVKNALIDSEASSSSYGITSQNQTATGQVDLELTLENTTINGFKSKGLYLTNTKKLVVKNCKFVDCASGEMDQPNSRGDYAIDLNLCAVQDAVVEITNCTFEGDCGKKACIAVKARGGASDEGASDIPKELDEATIKSVTLIGNSFLSTSPADYSVGSSSKTEGDVVNTTAAYAIDIHGNPTKVACLLSYKTPKDGESETLVVPANATATKTADGDLTVAKSDTMQNVKGAYDIVYTF